MVDRIRIFYREAGDPARPTILLLHGFPSSSQMYRDLIPLLADRFHLIAPDYPGSGNSDAPGRIDFEPTFERLTDVMEHFVTGLGLKRFAVYMQDFGGPVGFRLAVRHPEWIHALIVQNANAYIEGLAPGFLQRIKERTGTLTPAQRAEAERLLSPEAVISRYVTGARDRERLNPDAWSIDSWALVSPESKRIQIDLLADYHANLSEYPRWQEYLRTHQPRTLIVWGRNDTVFLPAGAEAFKKDLRNVELQFFDTGHFALEEEAAGIATAVKRFLH